MRKLVWLAALVAGMAQAQMQPALKLEAVRVEATWVLLRWSGAQGPFELTYRQVGRPRNTTVTVTDLPGPSYSAVNLRHDTRYDFTVRPLQQPPATPGKRAKPVEAKLRVRTELWTPRQVGVLAIYPTGKLQTFADDQATPRIVGWKEFLYVAENHGGGIHLSQVHPRKWEIEQRRELVAPQAGLTAGLIDTALRDNQLYVLYTLGEGHYIVIFDLELQEFVGEPLPVPRALALEAYWQQVWLLTLSGEPPKLAVLSLEASTEGASIVWAETPPGGAWPSLAVFNEQLLVGLSDQGWLSQSPGYEPLWSVLFDAAMFHSARKLANLGRNFMPRGQQLGPNFYMVYSSDIAYLSDAGKYADLMLSILPPVAPTVETMRYVDDGKYNFSADITALGNSLYVVYEKHEQAPDGQTPVRSYGNFIGGIDIGPPPEKR